MLINKIGDTLTLTVSILFRFIYFALGEICCKEYSALVQLQLCNVVESYELWFVHCFFSLLFFPPKLWRINTTILLTIFK